MKNKNRIYISIFFAAVLIAVTLMPLIFRLADDRGINVSKTSYALNTVIKITASGKNADSAADKAIKEINRIDRLMSAHRADSEISVLNLSGSNKQTLVSAEVFSLIKNALNISEKTDGAFDISLKPLSDLWNIQSDNPHVPSDLQIEAALEKTGYQHIILNEENHSVSFDKDGMSIDLGAIAKGYAANRAVKILKECGIKNALIDLGGNVYAIGTNKDGKTWRIGLQTPWKARGEYFKVIEAKDTSVVTSGAYERFFKENGKIYHHILSPKTGKPSNSGIQSATVISDNSALADALSTAVYVMGKDGAEKAARDFKGVKIIILTDSGEILEY